ncbi:G patch domain-containing protein 11-like [Limulus polyphemus]|uniref:G patch domain-containing protein 11-like n=1 Tax=Limulus polyphemus TaxID=6850 RepID=A0ABM1BQU4_LIMPO|nr:G patch domain-containing protein 11-like [Limulus polyphemus]
MAEEDEVDYMSDTFVTVPQENDIRPGLVFNHSLKRKHELEKQQIESKKINFQKPIKQLEEENRLKGLSNALPENNKGFAMLQKMGYKPGMSLGKKGNRV